MKNTYLLQLLLLSCIFASRIHSDQPHLQIEPISGVNIHNDTIMPSLQDGLLLLSYYFNGSSKALVEADWYANDKLIAEKKNYIELNPYDLSCSKTNNIAIIYNFDDTNLTDTVWIKNEDYFYYSEIKGILYDTNYNGIADQLIIAYRCGNYRDVSINYYQIMGNRFSGIPNFTFTSFDGCSVYNQIFTLSETNEITANEMLSLDIELEHCGNIHYLKTSCIDSVNPLIVSANAAFTPDSNHIEITLKFSEHTYINPHRPSQIDYNNIFTVWKKNENGEPVISSCIANLIDSAQTGYDSIRISVLRENNEMITHIGLNNSNNVLFDAHGNILKIIYNQDKIVIAYGSNMNAKNIQKENSYCLGYPRLINKMKIQPYVETRKGAVNLLGKIFKNAKEK